MSKVYLLHFNEKLSHAQHYIGFVEGEEESLENRLVKHKSGTGAKIMAALADKNITFQLARVWDDSDRKFERKLKNRKNASKLCPICKNNNKSL